MQISKKTLATVLIGLASVIGIVSIFCFFGTAFNIEVEPIVLKGPSMFTFMFGGTWAVASEVPEAAVSVKLQAGMTVLFVIELIVLLLAVVVIAGNISKKFKENTTICLASIITLLTLVAVILSFCTKGLTKNFFEELFGIPFSEISNYVKLSAGPISFSVLGIVGIISNVAGIILCKKAE